MLPQRMSLCVRGKGVSQALDINLVMLDGERTHEHVNSNSASIFNPELSRYRDRTSSTRCVAQDCVGLDLSRSRRWALRRLVGQSPRFAFSHSSGFH